MKHLRITFTDGTVEDLESRWTYRDLTEPGLLIMLGDRRDYGMGREVGPGFPLANIRKYEWVEGYK